MSPDELFAKWKQQLEELWRETSYIFWSRKLYRTIVHMFQTNPQLQEYGGDVWDWIRMLYGTQAAMGIRKDMDDQSNALSLVNLLRDLERHAGVLTRERHRANWGNLQHIMSQAIDSAFEAAGGPPGPGKPSDHLRADAIAQERRALERITATSVRCANLVLAHRQQMTVTVPFKDIEEALGALYSCFRSTTHSSLARVWLRRPRFRSTTGYGRFDSHGSPRTSILRRTNGTSRELPEGVV